GANIRSFGNQTIGGTGSIRFEGTTGGNRGMTIEGTSTLTLDDGFTVSGGRVIIGQPFEQGGTNQLGNNGNITADTADEAITIQPNGSFTNNGTVRAINGGVLSVNNLNAASTGSITATASTLNLGGNWSNSGTINTTNSTLNLGGAFSTDGLGTI